MKKLILLILLIVCAGWAQAQQHPCIYASASDKTAVQQKIATEPWAKESFERMRTQVEKYADRHATDPQWIVSRLSMYWKEGERYTQCYLKKQNWDRGEGNAPVPTVRMPGMRTWNKYANVPLEDRPPYNETGDMWGVNRLNPLEAPVLVPYKESGHMIRGNNGDILTLAENAAFVYWITGKEKYARFAADIFNTWLVGTYYMNPILDPDKSCGSLGGWEPGGICGYYDYEQIHDDLALRVAPVYDFMYTYLIEHPHPHLKEIGKDTRTVASEVFKRFINIGMVRGGKTGNWNVNGWNMMLRPVLVLDSNDAYADGKGKEYYLNFLVNETTSYHDAIPDMVKTYDPVTGLWPESPGYAFSVSQMLLDWAAPLRRVGIDIIERNPILQKAAMAVFPWMDESANMVVFGDSRGGSANFLTLENLLAYYTCTGNLEEAQKVAAALNKGIALGKYQRNEATWAGICTYVSDIPAVTTTGSERTSYSEHHRFITLKNWEAPYRMMATLYGGKKGYHLTPNGLAVQFYGYGYALAPDAAAYESYWSKDQVYHQSSTGANTILPGYTEGEITVNAMEPRVEAFTNTYELTPWVNFADVTAGEKRRVIVMVRTSDTTGYYADIFRSDLEDNDYLFHNVGTSLTLFDANGRELSTSPVEKLNTSYHPGYDWLTNLYGSPYTHDFVATWKMPEQITSRLWMTGAVGRTLYRMDAPATTLSRGLTPGSVSMPPSSTPTLLVRQKDNNASINPFMAVYEAYKGTPSVTHVERLAVCEEGAGLKIENAHRYTDYLLSATDNRLYKPTKQCSLRGNLGMIRESEKKITMLYLGNGSFLQKGNCSLEAEHPIYAAVYQLDGVWYYSSTGTAKLKIGKKTWALVEGYNQRLLNFKGAGKSANKEFVFSIKYGYDIK